MLRSQRSWQPTLAALCLSMTVSAVAQQTSTTPTPAADSSAGGALAEVVVTAQKRAEPLQRVPVSVTALTADQLADMKLDNPTVLTETVPNLQVNGIIGGPSPVFSLRGVSMFDYSLNQSSPVATYVDEVYKGNFALLGVELFDMERVEVLRGPQGTLYGKNTTGGAINFISRTPSFESPNRYLKLGVGNYSRYDVEGGFDATLVPDRLAARLAFTYAKADGWFKNKLPGGPDMDAVGQWAARATVLFKASDTVDMLLRYSHSKQDMHNYAIFARPGPLGVGAGIFQQFHDLDPIANPNTDYFRDGLADDEVEVSYTPKRHQTTDTVSLTANAGIASNLTLTSISAYAKGNLFNPEATDGSPIEVFKTPYVGTAKQFTQDLRLTSSFDAPFNFILGTYYQHEAVFNSTELQLWNGIDVNLDGSIDVNDCIDSGGALACRYGNQFDQNRNSWAVYADTSYQLSEPLKLRLGLRYNHDNAALRNFIAQLRGPDDVPIANLIPGDPINVDATLSNELHDTATTGKVGLDFTPHPGLLLYASYSRGYRSGAFSAQAFFSPIEATGAKPETLDAYEIGFKSQWLNGRLRANGSAFHYTYKNQQVIDVNPVTLAQPLVNLGKSKIDGAELELVMRPFDALTLHAGFGWLDAKLKDAVLRGEDLSGNRLPDSPKFTGNLALDWEAYRVEKTVLVVGLDGSYAGAQYFEPFNVPRLRQKSYGLFNARVALRSANDRWEAALWGRNLTNEFYITSAADVSGIGFDYTHRGMPRTYGLELNLNLL